MAGSGGGAAGEKFDAYANFNSQMPGFKSALSDTDRWHILNFNRTLAPK